MGILEECLIDYFCKLKDPIKPLLNSGVYKLNCPCGHFYIGMTTRNFQIRTKEHINEAFTHSHMNSAFATHISTCKHFTPKHRFTFKPEILHKNNNFHILSSLEAIEIAQQRTSTFLLNNITDYSNSNFINNLISNSIFNWLSATRNISKQTYVHIFKILASLPFYLTLSPNTIQRYTTNSSLVFRIAAE